ncbi:MAG: ABC transporter ATP-binding protein [Gammaproteobacteria bacterium]|uniref:ABC transporter ATP-binding protein n=1 Tax=Candidatus Thiopontia autotrophica TaxID=2841688 RepID=A0A8J6TSA5_9GAMM|nr:ABC transporter ATP-binding protein [Candidatus Thiopontia autotrophica]MBL6969521.1 ABC transporter ATP-binding protein [Gammaproteobacteria bacterium]
MSSLALDIVQVQKQFGATNALRGVGFSVEQGEFFGLLGPNGAGKSTLINIMGGLVRPTAGQVKVMGYDVVTQYRHSRSQIGVVPQELVYDPFFTVWEMLKIQSGYFGLGRENRQWLEELLDTLKLSDKRDENLHNLSGGMKRRVLIAQALVHRPPVVVLDEPTAGVDVELRRALWDFAHRLHKEGHTILLTTHYLEEAESMCDRIAILNRGALVALSDKQELISQSSWQVAVVGKMPDPNYGLPTNIESAVISRSRSRTEIRLSRVEQDKQQLLQQLTELGVDSHQLQIREPTLEEVFLDLTGD